jgi:hypothetical protein
MTQARKEALIKQRDVVKAGKIVQAVDARNLWPEIGIWLECCTASQGSLGAAKVFHEAVLPEWRVEVFGLDGEIVLRRNRPIDRAYGDAMAFGCPARAWLLAILEALIAQEPDT